MAYRFSTSIHASKKSRGLSGRLYRVQPRCTSAICRNFICLSICQYRAAAKSAILPASPLDRLQFSYRFEITMSKVILITGASTGIGNETAKLFQTKDWKVAATMRDPKASADLARIADIECFRLDVTEPDSVRNAIDETIARFGRIDAVVNNAGYGLIGAFEAASEEEVRRQFEVNI